MPDRNKLKPRRSYTANSVPLSTDLDTHEMAVNWTDSKIFVKDGSGQILSFSFGGSGGTGQDTELRAYFLPTAPTNVTGTAGNAQVALTWTASSTISQIPVTDYVVQYSSDNGSTWATFSDGTSTSASATVTGLTNGTAYKFRVAGVNAVGQGAWSTASGSVTPTAGDPLFSSVSLLLHMDGSGATFTDSSAYGNAITAYGNATQTTTQSKWGGKSLYLDGSGDYLTLAASSAFGFGTGDFCLECWYYPTQNSGSNETILDLRAENNAQWLWFGKSGSNAIRVYDGTNLLTGGSVTLNDWNHIAWSRANGDNAVYVNGTRVINWTNGGNVGSTRPVVIGSNTNLIEEQSKAYIDDLRITKGVARYTGSTITVPTAAFPDA